MLIAISRYTGFFFYEKGPKSLIFNCESCKVNKIKVTYCDLIYKMSKRSRALLSMATGKYQILRIKVHLIG